MPTVSHNATKELPKIVVPDVKNVAQKVKQLNIHTAYPEEDCPLAFSNALPSAGIYIKHRWVMNPETNEHEFLVPQMCDGTFLQVPQDLITRPHSPLWEGDQAKKDYFHPDYMPITFERIEHWISSKEDFVFEDLVHFLGLIPGRHIQATDAGEDTLLFCVEYVLKRLAEEAGISPLSARFQALEEAILESKK